MVEKAYAKLRYCYKATLDVGIQQLIFEFTGRHSKRIQSANNNADKVVEILVEEYKKGNVLIFMAEGEHDKKVMDKE